MRWKIHKPAYGWKHYRFIVWYDIKRKVKKLVCGIAKAAGKQCTYGYNSYCWRIMDCPILKGIKPITQIMNGVACKSGGIIYVSYADNIPKLDFHEIIFGEKE